MLPLSYPKRLLSLFGNGASFLPLLLSPASKFSAERMALRTHVWDGFQGQLSQALGCI